MSAKCQKGSDGNWIGNDDSKAVLRFPFYDGRDPVSRIAKKAFKLGKRTFLASKQRQHGEVQALGERRFVAGWNDEVDNHLANVASSRSRREVGVWNLSRYQNRGVFPRSVAAVTDIRRGGATVKADMRTV